MIHEMILYACRILLLYCYNRKFSVIIENSALRSQGPFWVGGPRPFSGWRCFFEFDAAIDFTDPPSTTKVNHGPAHQAPLPSPPFCISGLWLVLVLVLVLDVGCCCSRRKARKFFAYLWRISIPKIVLFKRQLSYSFDTILKIIPTRLNGIIY